MTFSGITTQSTDAVFQSLRTSERGLSSATAQQLLKQYGLNQVRSQEHTWRPCETVHIAFCVFAFCRKPACVSFG